MPKKKSPYYSQHVKKPLNRAKACEMWPEVESLSMKSAMDVTGDCESRLDFSLYMTCTTTTLPRTCCMRFFRINNF